ncbi:18036_t:CDS:2 [Funneliformis geosporum]|uniref:Mitochondrial genome maintenance protein MGM101 n=1 Tax=Funneliformis geosporum TaxID=1117311 RepID=A0A9W4SDN8_9GLOM|nr:6928_t:CDS:2 [Funneliformis geosporum]CAI2166505.1 18036_t:CDS:2 [Funneliformis geosporum]
MASYVKSSRFENALANVFQQRIRIFAGIRHNTKVTQCNNIMKSLIRQRFYATNSLPSHGSADKPTLDGESENASYLTKSKSNDSSSFLTKSKNDNFSSFAPTTDWSKSFFGLSTKAFPKEAADILLAPIKVEDVECKPDGMLYLPEIKYRRILNKAFGPGGWGLAPRGDNSVSPRTISREFALICHGRLVSVARGEQEYFDPSGLATAAEGAKSNALMRCCKDLGIASELWDPTFIRDFKKQYCEEYFCEHVTTKKKRRIWVKKGSDVEYPYIKSSGGGY